MPSEHSRVCMSSRDRVLETFRYGKPDRIPLDYGANPAIHGRVCRALGIDPHAPDGLERLLRALDVDFRGLGAPCRPKGLFPELPDRRVDPIYGFVMRRVEHESGEYWDFCDFPLKEAGPEIVASYPIAHPDDFDYDVAMDMLSTFDDKAVYVGDPGTADIINSTGRLMGMEDTLVNLWQEDEATLAYIDRAIAMELEILERLIVKARGRVDFLWIGEDLGTQHAPMISLELYRKVLRPRHQRYINLADAYRLPVMVHTCGSSSWAYEDFIEMGVTAVDTLQPEATGMSPRTLVERFGGRLAFHGCISTAGPLAYGTVADIEREVHETMAFFKPHGGYCMAPTHWIQDNTPVENVLAMYRTAQAEGWY